MDIEIHTKKSNNRISIYDIQMSEQLKKVLQRNSIMYLSQLYYYSREDILRFRGINDKTVAEIEKIYQKYNIRQIQPIYIDDLPISRHAKNILHELDFSLISELDAYDYISLTKKFTQRRQDIYSIMQELNDIGYLLPSETEISIYDVQMSKKLLRIFEKYYVLYLSELSIFSKEEIRTWRQLGEKSMVEVEEICQRYNIQMRSVREIVKNLSDYEFPFTINDYITLFNLNIIQIEDFNNITTHDLYSICTNNYLKTMKSYYILKDNGICFQPWNDMYMFEFFSMDIAKLLDRNFNVRTITKLKCRIDYINRYIDKQVDLIPLSLKTCLKTILAKYSNLIS